MDKIRDEWFGWIPSLTGKDPHVLKDHAIPESTQNFDFTKDQDDPELFYAHVTVKEKECTIPIAIQQGFIVMMFENMDARYQKNIAYELFSTLITCYHVDITHDGENRLLPIKADSYNDAVYRYAYDILSISEDFITLSATTTNVEALKMMYLTRLGLVEYGKAFLRRYASDLDPITVNECNERLESMSRFITAIYGTIRDSIQDNLAHRNQEMSESMEMLAQKTVSLSMAVLGLTWFSAVIALASLSIDCKIMPPSIGLVAALAILPPIAVFAYWFFKHRAP